MTCNGSRHQHISLLTHHRNATVTSRHGISPGFYRYLPFAVFMGFIGLDELIVILSRFGFFRLETTTLYYLYPIKTLAVGSLLFLFKARYHELNFGELASIRATLASCVVGLLVFALWIKMEWVLGSAGSPQGFNPELLPGGATRSIMTLFRFAGAVLVVPLMEELFWRSFFIRYLIDRNFDSVRLGTFTWGSFLFTVVLFGVEHHFIFAGIMAGIFYNLVLYMSRSLAQCVLAHAVTNAALAVYVVSTGKWHFW